MPSLLSKLGATTKKKSNPYLNPHHPGHNPIPKPSTTTTTTQPQRAPSPRKTASPRTSHDFLAEARHLAGFDPVTGRQRQRRQIDAAEQNRSAYQNRAAASTQTTGSKYEILRHEEMRKREVEQRIKAARGGVEYYAPERRVEEFYAGGGV